MQLVIRLAMAVAAIMGAAQPGPAQKIVSVRGPSTGSEITIDYPPNGAIFPPDMTAPTFVWRDPDANSDGWTIQIYLPGGSLPLQFHTTGERVRMGEIDERCVASTNQRPTLTPQQIASRTWTPHTRTWSSIRAQAAGRPVRIRISGPKSRGEVTIEISKDEVGAPIFYRDVPLMPEETERGVIMPLGTSALPLVAWRLRNVGETRSRLLLEGMPTCANCHSFSADGRTLAMDLDGPQNDKGLYAIVPVTPRMSVGSGDVIEWSSFRERAVAESRVGFMSQVSPDGRFVVTSVNRTDYVANFKDYRFLQVFFPTRGVLAWYSRTSREMHLLPGADDPQYVQTGAVWSPDGRYLVFARAGARDAYRSRADAAKYANDPNETQIRYDLYRIPFNNGAGGRAEAVAGASRNGKSNSFPKISPDGKWLVYVRANNGELMRPDSELYIVPSQGGRARRMRCNTSSMNSWHSFSPNGRWLVFSSKSESPYTQMFLTHLDQDGNDSPAIRIENATAANRAVNIPEFVNVPADGLLNIEVSAVEVYRRFNLALKLTGEGAYEAAISEWREVVRMAPQDAKARNNLGFTLAQQGRLEEGLAELLRALELNPAYVAGHNNIALVLESLGRIEEAIGHWEAALRVNSASGPARKNLLRVLKQAAWVRATASDVKLRDGKQAVAFAERALQLDAGDPAVLDTLAAAYAQAGRFRDAVEISRRALIIAARAGDQGLVDGLKARKTGYEAGLPFRGR